MEMNQRMGKAKRWFRGWDRRKERGRMKSFHLCICEGEAIAVSDWTDEADEPCVGLMMWRYGSGGYPRFPSRLEYIKYKIRLIRQIIKVGHPWLDDIRLDKEEAIKLVESVNGILAKYEDKGEGNE